MQNYKERLLEKTAEKKSHLCLGVDLHLKSLPSFFNKTIEKKNLEYALTKWTTALIEAASPLVPAIKFQSSFFEALGPFGFTLLKENIKTAKSKGLITILDAKRCDISSTMEAYGFSAFEQLKADALTVVSYMGADVIRPLYQWMKQGHGVYSVFLSSNDSGYQRQSQTFSSKNDTLAESFHEEILKEISSKNLKPSFGLVVGVKAYEKNAGSLLPLSHEYNFLMPGMGFQGGQITKNFDRLKTPKNSYLLPMSRSLSGIGDENLAQHLEEIRNFDDYQTFVSHRITDYQKKLGDD